MSSANTSSTNVTTMHSTGPTLASIGTLRLLGVERPAPLRRCVPVKPAQRALNIVLVKVHPHACGENDAENARAKAEARFTPTRVGKTSENTTIDNKQRFTPTRVGKTGCNDNSEHVCAVHPHACGENACRQMFSASTDGSPPRVWGKRPCHSCASPSSSVHPHACGENGIIRSDNSLRSGSPPRVWGKRRRVGGQLLPSRFTPTRVGKTQGSYTVSPFVYGSPPRVWGKPGELGRYGQSEPVHPHACGAKRALLLPLPAGRRFTPTRVGKTCTDGKIQ